MSYAELGDLRLYYERGGEGEPELLFVHGWCCDHTAFQPQFDYFERMHTVTALDLRGCGKSDCPESGYHIRDFADDLAQFCVQVAIEKPVVIGHSLGGMIAVELAARYPSFPRALVLVGPGPTTHSRRPSSSSTQPQTSSRAPTAKRSAVFGPKTWGPATWNWPGG